MEAKLYVIPGSHPSRDGDEMLERKGIPYKRVDLMPVISKGALQAVRLSRDHGPALKIDGRKVQGSREIAARARPDPARAAAAARRPGRARRGRGGRAWGDEVLQPVARRILWNALQRDRAPLASYSEGARLGRADRRSR